MAEIVGLIPAAGEGTRIAIPYPKELLLSTYDPQGAITVLESNIIQLANANVKNAVIVISSKKQVIADYFGDYCRGVNLKYVYQRTERVSREGLPDALTSAFYEVGDRHCLMLMGDVYFTDPLVAAHLVLNFDSGKDIAAVGVWKTETPERFGVVDIQNGQVIGVTDKPVGHSTPANFWGACIYSNRFWKYLAAETKTFSHALHMACPIGVSAIEMSGNYLDLGTPKSYIEAVKEINRD